MRKRANGEGSIYQRTDGRWSAAITLANGKRQTIYGRSREEVGKKLTTALKNRDDGLPVVNGQQTTAGYLTEWLVLVKSTLRPTTWRRYDELIRLHAVPAIGTVKLARLGPQHLTKAYGGCLENGLAPATVAQLHRILHRALGQAARWGLVVRNVADLVDAPRVARREMQTLSAGQVRQLLDASATYRTGDDGAVIPHRLHALFVLAASTGLREGELLALRWRDVDLSTSTLRVTGTLQRTAEGLRIEEPKTRRSRRPVHLSATAVEALKAHRVRQNADRLRLGQTWEDRDLVFANAVGRPVDPTNLLRQEFRPLLNRAGLPAIRFHDLRHTAATLMLEAGIHPKVVSEMLGHSQVSITLDLYSHVTPNMQQQAAAAMDAVLG
jgi:integrase